ncbi:MAG: zinc-ribbon domain containing protein [Chloroflexi bacterium]|nr:zinc-ribbon domain containing protein [Chloroflexota bacterium]
MSFADRILRCRDCGADFVFSAGEQEFFALKGLTNEPGRCPSCRAARRGQRESGGAGGYSSGSYGGAYDRAPREMHPATCAQCGQETMVPFLPRGDRPVYCSNCYDRVRTSRPRR